MPVMPLRVAFLSSWLIFANSMLLSSSKRSASELAFAFKLFSKLSLDSVTSWHVPNNRTQVSTFIKFGLSKGRHTHNVCYFLRLLQFLALNSTFRLLLSANSTAASNAFSAWALFIELDCGIPSCG